jgi:hypothetical protein
MKITAILTEEIEFEWEDGTKGSVQIPEWLYKEIDNLLNEIEEN